MKIVKVIVDELPESASQCEAEKTALVLPGVNSHLIRVYCKIDLNGTKHSLMSIAEYNVRRCPNCPLSESPEVQEGVDWSKVPEVMSPNEIPLFRNTFDD